MKQPRTSPACSASPRRPEPRSEPKPGHHLLEDIVLRYLSSCAWPASTLASVSSTFSSMRMACGAGQRGRKA